MGVRNSAVGRVLNHAIEKFVQLTAEVWKGFNQNARLYTAAGEDSVPCKEDQIILVKIDGTGKYIALGVLTVSQGAQPGEKILYARDADGEIVSKIAMLNDGSVNVNNKGDVTIDTQGDTSVTVKGDITITTEGTLKETGKGDITKETSGTYRIKAQSIEINGLETLVLKTMGSAGWCPNGVPNCFMTGAPHGGSAMGITGLKGS